MTGSLWFCFKDEATDFNSDIPNTDAFKSSKYKAKLLGNTVIKRACKNLRNVRIAVPLQHLSLFWLSLEMPLINCNVILKL